MINRIIIFLLRMKFNLKKGQWFTFYNQREPGTYCFTDTKLIKLINNKRVLSEVSINWLTDKNCKISKVR